MVYASLNTWVNNISTPSPVMAFALNSLPLIFLQKSVSSESEYF